MALEDGVFDADHRQHLEQQISADNEAAAVLGRIRATVHNPSVGVPGLVEQQEEIDPNYVAEYLDHQMPDDVQNRFETFCLSADKYIAEIASIHQILSNVLGEPARSSRECRLRCYEVLRKPPAPLVFEKPKTSEAVPERFVTNEETSEPKPKMFRFWRLFPLFPLFRAKPAERPQSSAAVSFYSFKLFIAGAILCYFLLYLSGKIDFRIPRAEHAAPISRNEHEPAHIKPVPEPVVVQVQKSGTTAAAPQNTGQEPFALGQPEPIRQTNFTEETAAAANTAQHAVKNPAENTPDQGEKNDNDATASALPPDAQEQDLFLAAAAITEPPAPEEVPENFDQTVTAAVPPKPETAVKPLPAKKYPIIRTAEEAAALQTERDEPQITSFQPILAPEKKRSDEQTTERSVNRLGNGQQSLRMPATSWQSVKNSLPAEPFRLEDAEREDMRSVPPLAAAAEPVPPVSLPHPFPPERTLAMLPKKAVPQPVTLMSAAVPRVLGRVISSAESNLLFSASGIDEQWSLAPVPSNLTGGQYLLSANPFRGVFELTAGFRIEMIGDVKLSILPMDVAGVQGIFVDYGRIVIHPLKPDASMRIEMENVSGVMTISGASGTVFIDTFAEVHEQHVQPPEGAKPKISPILGLVPKNGETLSWQSAGQPQPFTTSRQGSLVLPANPYRFGDIKNLPNWIGNLPETPEDRRLAETCRRYFTESQGSSSKALPLMLQDESAAVRALAFRLLGDLGEFSFAVQAMAEKRTDNKAIRSMLVPYFNEVMKRDAETVQRFADAITAVKQSKSSP